MTEATKPGRPDDALRNFVEAVDRLSVAVDKIAPRMDRVDSRLQRLILALGIAASVFVAIAIAAFVALNSLSGRMAEVTRQLDEAARSLQTVREEQAQTQQKVESVETKVDAVKEEQPTVELRAPDGGVGRPTAVVIVRPKTPATAKPSGDAGAPPAIAIPVKLPEGSRVEDAGASP